MREGSLVAFTLLTQAAAGACAFLLAFEWRAVRAGAGASVEAAALPVLSFALVAALLGLAASFLHLGSPRNAVRALGNLGSSWLSREILLAALFTAALAATVLLRFRPGPAGSAAGFAHGFAAVAGFGLVVTMVRAYRLRTVPSWDQRATPVAFFATAVALGALAVAAGLALRGPASTDPARGRSRSSPRGSSSSSSPSSPGSSGSGGSREGAEPSARLSRGRAASSAGSSRRGSP
ncbi:MAG: dimethyl sulfoxide reductase anchor subunit [Holophagales bacterium]|nr:dimethyl sulfoxide reductase anchor subunit [Holophagales bacterium]